MRLLQAGHGVLEWLAGLPALDVVEDHAGVVALHVVGSTSHVRGDGDVVQLAYGVVGRKWLFPEDVQRCAGDVPGTQRGQQRIFVHHRSARRVDEDGIGPHQLQLTGAEETAGLGRQRAMNRNDVGAGQQLIEAHQLDTRWRLGDERVEGDHVHAEAASTIRHQAADGSQPQQADGAAVELRAPEVEVGQIALRHPAVLAQLSLGAADAASVVQQQAQREVGHRDGVATRGAEHDHVPFRGGIQIDVGGVAPARRHQLERGRRGEHRAIYGLKLADQHFHAVERCDELRGVHGAASHTPTGVHGLIAQRTQLLKPVSTELSGDQRLHAAHPESVPRTASPAAT